MSRRRRATFARPRLAVACLLAFAAAFAPAAGAAPRCDSNTALTLLGLDTAAQRALFMLPIPDSGAGWILELDLAKKTATAWPDADPSGHFGGSTGPGAVIAARRCGDRCLQPVVFRGGRWETLGEPLLASATMTFHATWDRKGAPWVVLHARAGESTVAAKAYRFEGGDWRSEGGLSIEEVGSPGVYAAPAGEEGVVSGDGVFAAGKPPRRWLNALPAAEGAQPGELIWAGGGTAVHIGADGGLRSTADGGKKWEELRWQPWSGGEGDLAWRRGRDWWIELPEGERSMPPVAVWNDRRVATKTRLYLAQREATGAWRLLVETPQGLLTEGGERLPYNHLFRFGADRWVLVTGCVSRKDGAAIVTRAVAGDRLLSPELVPVKSPPAATTAPSR